MGSVRITSRVLSLLDGSGPFQGQSYSLDPDKEAAAKSWVQKVQAAPTRKDGAVTVRLTLPEATVCYSYADTLQDGASCELSEPDNLADYNAGRALMRNLEKAFGVEVTRW